MTTKENIEAMAMSDEQEFNAQMTELAEPFWLKDSMKQGEFFDVNGFARALLASKPAVPWIAHWAGSNPYKGWSIRCGRDEIVWFGETVSSETVEAIVLAHNKCFDCDGTGCVMNCSGLRSPAPASPSGEDASEQSAAPMAGPKMPNGFQISCDPLSAVEACINDYEQERETPVSNAILSGLYKARQVLTLPRAAEDAHKAYVEASIRLHKEFANDGKRVSTEQPK